jgi:hypothetical protein
VSERAAATSTENTVSKLGAHLRWAIEREGVAPEGVITVMLFQDAADRDRMMRALARNASAEKRGESDPYKFYLHGVPLILSVKGA